jgi:hypothetical protein
MKWYVGRRSLPLDGSSMYCCLGSMKSRPSPERTDKRVDSFGCGRGIVRSPGVEAARHVPSRGRQGGEDSSCRWGGGAGGRTERGKNRSLVCQGDAGETAPGLRIADSTNRTVEEPLRPAGTVALDRSWISTHSRSRRNVPERILHGARAPCTLQQKPLDLLQGAVGTRSNLVGRS